MNASVPVRTYAAELCGFMRLQSPVAYSVIGIVRTEVSLLGGPITILVRAPCDTLVSCSLCRAFAIRIALSFVETLSHYSLSTKIAESLRSGACILAYGPSEIAAIDYLRRYRAAYILEKAEELPNAIRHLCEEANEYSHYTLCAQSLAEQFHSAEVNEECLRDIFVEAISNYKTAEVKECKTTK